MRKNSETIQFRVSPSLKKAIEDYAYKKDESVGEFLKRIARERIELDGPIEDNLQIESSSNICVYPNCKLPREEYSGRGPHPKYCYLHTTSREKF